MKLFCRILLYLIFLKTQIWKNKGKYLKKWTKFNIFYLKIKRKQLKDFLIEQLGGSGVKYVGKDMVSAHSGLGITNKDYDSMGQIFLNVLEKLRIKPNDVKEI